MSCVDNKMTATLSMPIHFEFDKSQEIRYEILRLIKEDEGVKDAIRRAIEENKSKAESGKSPAVANMNLILELKEKLRQRDKELKRIKEEISILKQNELDYTLFKDILQMYYDYQNMTEDVKEQFSNVFLQNTFISFIACVSQQESPIEIWDGIKRYMDEDEIESSKVEFMKTVLVFSVAMSNGSRRGAKQLEIFEPGIGEPFSDRWHCVYDAGGNKQGRIEEVKLAGIRYLGEFKALRPSLVLLR